MILPILNSQFVRFLIAPAFAALCAFSVLNTTASAATSWLIKKNAWSASDEKNYSAFILALGQDKCTTVDKCLKSKANPYRGSDPADVTWTADCAKFPYLLRAYFAWKNGLPFGYVKSVDSADGNSKDLRYSRNGNIVTGRRSFIQEQAGQVLNGTRALKIMLQEVNSAMYRIHPHRDGVDKSTSSDFYSVHVDRDQVRPGTIVYDAAGHVVVIFKVEDDGRARYFDAHPDNTISRGVYGEKFARSRPGTGAGFKNFRPLKLLGAKTGSHDELIGGRITADPFAKTSGYSVEQFWGTEAGSGSHDDDYWRKARFKVNGREMDFTDFVRARLAIGELKYHPVEEMRDGMEAICGDLHDRVVAVQTGVSYGLQDKKHPDRLPENIYGTSGEWEEFATPSRDARLKVSYVELRNRVQKMVELYKKGDPTIEYKGTDLPGDLRTAYIASTKDCSIEYRRSNGTHVKLGYDELTERLFNFSFDPYHCPELRWGASSEDELSSCPASETKLAWYRAEQRLRNQTERSYNTRMDFTLKDLQNAAPGSGSDQAPDIDLRGYLESL